MTTARLQLGVVVLALALAFAPIPESVVETQFSNRLYPVIQGSVTAFSNVVPFALFDVFLVGVSGWWVWRLSRDVVRRRKQGGWLFVLGRTIARTVSLAATLYVVFLLAWGFNYRRFPLVQRLAPNAQAMTAEAGHQLALTAVTEVNARYAEAHASVGSEPPIDRGPLAEAFLRTQTLLAVRAPARPGRPKWTLLDPYFTSAGVAGMTDPYFLETLVASDLLPIERPFVLAHEWSHLAGFANEGEANFLGWLTCVRGSALDRYSGWLFLYSEVVAGLPRAMRTDTASRLAAGPRDDLRAIAERLQRHVRPRISNAGWQVYDRYLKANRVQAGAASYREVVRLILGARFDSQWAPALQPAM